MLFRSEVIHVERTASQLRRAYRDTLNKMRIATSAATLPQTFVWMMDDIYFVRPVSFSDLSHPRHQGQLRQTYGMNNEYLRVKTSTCEAIAWATFDWATHLPHVVQKFAWEFIWDKYQLDKQELLWEILYGAEFYELGVHYAPFFKRIQGPDLGGIEAAVINNSKRGWTSALRNFLRERFPERIKEERCP